MDIYDENLRANRDTDYFAAGYVFGSHDNGSLGKGVEDIIIFLFFLLGFVLLVSHFPYIFYFLLGIGVILGLFYLITTLNNYPARDRRAYLPSRESRSINSILRAGEHCPPGGEVVSGWMQDFTTTIKK